MTSNADLRIVLLGKTGSGKSSTANTILKRDEFLAKHSLVPVTVSCQTENVDLDRRTISVTDTPGIFEKAMTAEELKNESMTSEELKNKSMTPEKLKNELMTPEELQTEIKKCVEMSVPGPHVFLLVIRLDDRITAEDMNAVKCIQKNFGEDAVKYTIVLFTHADVLEDETLEEYVKTSNDIKALLNQYGNRYHSFNNKTEGYQDQVITLLENIDEMVKGNGGMYYTTDMYKKVQRRIDKENFRRKAISVGVGVAVCVAGFAVVVSAVTTARGAGTAAAALGVVGEAAVTAVVAKAGGRF